MVPFAALVALFAALTASLGWATLPPPAYPDEDLLSKCPGYAASNVVVSHNGLVADLTLAGPACNTYGDDLERLKLRVTHESASRLHVIIDDADELVYQVPSSAFPRPQLAGPAGSGVDATASALRFDYISKPFSFTVTRVATGAVLFDSSAASLVFQSQYLRLRTSLPNDPNLYGLGEHADSLRLPTTDYTRTLWNNDPGKVPERYNLYGSHPLYLEHRSPAAGAAEPASHGVFLLNSNGMDIVLNSTTSASGQHQQYLQYNTIGGVIDLYFLSGPSPIEVAQQYAQVAGLPAAVPYWSLGFQQCQYGYIDAFELAEVVYNYSKAEIPLETIHVDIDLYDRRRIFSLDRDRFSLQAMRSLARHLHAHDQHLVTIVDVAIAYADYPPFRRGLQRDAFLRNPNGSVYQGVVWPGLVAFPDWAADNTLEYWRDEFAIFFNESTGVDVDGVWLDMNEQANFLDYPCLDPHKAAIGFPPPPPPVRKPPRPLSGWPCDFQPSGCRNKQKVPPPRVGDATAEELAQDTQALLSPRREPSSPQKDARHRGLPGRDVLNPKYALDNKGQGAKQREWNAGRGGLSNKTVPTDICQADGRVLYDTHNLDSLQMIKATRHALLHRRPGVRPFIVSRSSFAGTGVHGGHWTGDIASSWDAYRTSIRVVLAFTALFQVPMVGPDTCGFSGNTTEELCGRWAALSAFMPFYRNHNDQYSEPQEFYRWPSVAAAARTAIARRYALLDYLYTALHEQATAGTPALAPVFFHYPADPATYPLELQFFFGPALLVAPVTEAGASEVSVYLPDDVFYDWTTRKRVLGGAGRHTVSAPHVADVGLFVRGGTIIPVRLADGATTTAAVRLRPFELVIAPGRDGSAVGNLRLDDGASLLPCPSTDLAFRYADGRLVASGTFAALPGPPPRLVRISVLAADGAHAVAHLDVNIIMNAAFEVSVQVDVGIFHGFGSINMAWLFVASLIGCTLFRFLRLVSSFMRARMIWLWRAFGAWS